MKRRFFLLAVLIMNCMMMSSKRTTVVVSLDGFRWDYPYFYHTPMMDYMAEHGIESGLIPSFPSKTFPNHYTIATGLYPDHHGIIANSFYDTETNEEFTLNNLEQKMNPKYYGGEPVWITAHKQGLKTAVFYWPGSDVKIQGIYPDVYYVYDQKPRLTFKERIDGVLAQLRKAENERPELIMAYMNQPDKSGHKNGPHHLLTRQAVESVDSLIKFLYDGIQFLGLADEVNLIVLSDHGMTWVDQPHVVNVASYLNKDWYVSIQGNTPANVYVKKGCAKKVYQALKDIDHVKVWMKKDVPEYLHYGSNSRVGDVVVMPDIGYVVYDKEIEAGGTHGYDPTLQDMHALFRAIGPDIRHAQLPHFPNVNVYSLVCKLLGIMPADNDGVLPFEVLNK
ncbi:MAG: alkaline phosphatase family protein, partial [Prevotella sp.]|nr:alkaline phosphatase family protein [Prevotella sp.]